MAESGTEMIFYTGTFRQSLDVKRRVQVPSDWRPESKKAKYFVALWDHDQAGKHLRVIPMDEMMRMRDVLAKKVDEDPAKTVMKRLLGSGLMSAELDASGRIMLPHEMSVAAGIAPEVAADQKTTPVVVAGAVSHFEIWSAERHVIVTAADSYHETEKRKIIG